MSEKPYWIHFTAIGEEEIGYISVAQNNSHLPFDIKRIYWVYATPKHIERGNHAHKVCKQLLVAVSGSIEIELENIQGTKEIFSLDNPSMGLYVPVLHWRKIRMKSDAVLLCLASEEFEEGDYIRDYALFLSMKK